jgi:hypothetical protein
LPTAAPIETSATALLTLTSSSKSSSERWSHLAAGPPLMRFARPSTDVPACVHSREQAPFGPALRPAGSRSALVVSHHLDGFLRTRAAGLLHPAAGLGFTAFRSASEPVPPDTAEAEVGTVADLSSPLPAARFTPFEECPRRQPEPASPRALCLPAVAGDVRLAATTGVVAHSVPASREPRGTSAAEAALDARWHVPSSRDAVKLRSAETADPHVTGATGSRRTDPPSRGPPPATPKRRGERSSPERGCTSPRDTRGQTSPSAPESALREPSRGRGRGPPLARPDHRGDPSGPFETTRAADFKALLRRTSPWCRIAVAGESTPDPSMGFVPLQGPLVLRTSPVHAGSGQTPAGRGPKRPRSGSAVKPTIAPLGSLQRLPPARRRRSGGDGTSPGAEADRERRAFSARRPRPGSVPTPPRSGRSRPGEWGGVAGVCPETRS